MYIYIYVYKGDSVKIGDDKYLEKLLDKETDLSRRSEILIEMRELYEVSSLLIKIKNFFVSI